MTTPLIINKTHFINEATDFFHTIFAPALENGFGEIEIRVFPKGRPAQSLFYNSESNAAEKAYDLCNQGIDVYFGTNPRLDKGGKKENVKYLCAFHADLDYGAEGHKKKPEYADYESALNAIQQFPLPPTILVHTGGGFHCYWVLASPLKVSDYGLGALEGINKGISIALGADSTHDIGHVFRVPGTYNFKNPDRPRLAEVVSISGRKNSFEDFAPFKSEAKETKPKTSSLPAETPVAIPSHLSLEKLPISEKIKELILHGNDGSYLSRSEADMAVITLLVHRGISEQGIKQIFLTHAIGDKYRSHPSPDSYLAHTIKKAKERSLLSEEEMIDPLFISGAIEKDSKGYHLKIVRLQEYTVRKYRLKILDQERALFKYNGKCYEQLSQESLNKLCQNELKDHRELFKKSSLDDFIHYAIAEILIESEKAEEDQVNYLTLKNGLFSLQEGKLIPHTPDTFTTNLLPYDYDPSAKCPRFIQYLNEIFLEDQDKIEAIQEVVGYAFHKSIPTPAVFFLVGGGSNGKSVFINTISNLVGKENTSTVSFTALSDEHYIIQLFQKMINISGETPNSKHINTDLIKAVTSGDWVTGRDLYKHPMKFRPFAKHYLAMNKVPNILDNSHGMWRRIWMIEFPRTFSEEEMDRDLESKLAKELSGIFNWALEGYNRLRGKDFRLTESGSMKQSKDDYRDQMDSVRQFATDCLSKSKSHDDKLQLKDLYQMYLDYCQKDRNKDFERKPGFKKVLEGMGYKIENSKKDGNQVYVFNVKLLESNL